MERQDIVSGLRNAIERGSTLDKAIQSFINSGYNPQDVRDSAKVFGSTMPQMPSVPQVPPQTMPQAPPQVQQKAFFQSIQPRVQENIQQQPEFAPKYQQLPVIKVSGPQEKSNRGIIITLVAILLVLIIGLFIVMFNKDSISSFFSSLGF